MLTNTSYDYIISFNYYLMFTLVESAIIQVYSLQLLYKSTHYSVRYRRKFMWVFFY